MVSAKLAQSCFRFLIWFWDRISTILSHSGLEFRVITCNDVMVRVLEWQVLGG